MYNSKKTSRVGENERRNKKKNRAEFVGGVWMDAGDEERRREEERSETAGIKRGEV